MLNGIIFFVIATAAARIIGGVLGVIVPTVAAYHFFSEPYTAMICGMCLMMCLGSPTNATEIPNLPQIRRQYGSTFDIVGMLMFIGGLGVLVYQVF